MTVTRLAILATYACMTLPAFLFGLAWRTSAHAPAKMLLLPTLSSFLLLSAVLRELKVWLLGSDYSQRLYTAIEMNVLLAIIAAIYFGITKRWLPALASLILAADWLCMGAINSVV